MDRFIIRENIERFEQQLAAATDPDQRRVLSSLLETEKAKLAAHSEGEPPSQADHRTSSRKDRDPGDPPNANGPGRSP